MTDATGGGGSLPPPPQAARNVRHAANARWATGLLVQRNGNGLDTLFRARPPPGVGSFRKCTTSRELP
jgi:hypothetical protein